MKYQSVVGAMTVEAVQYTGDNLQEVLEFTGKHPAWNKWFKSFDDYKTYVEQHDNIFKVLSIYDIRDSQKAYPSNWIAKFPKGSILVYSDVAFKYHYKLAQGESK